LQAKPIDFADSNIHQRPDLTAGSVKPITPCANWPGDQIRNKRFKTGRGFNCIAVLTVRRHEMNRQLLISTAALAMAGAIAGFSPDASAASDLKSFSSMVCRANGAASLDVLTYSYQGVFNTSTTQNAVIICPLLKDDENEMNATNLNVGTLYVVAKAPGGSTGAANCTVEVGSLSSGAYSNAASTGTISAGGSGTMALSVETDPGWVYEPINLVCSLGPRVRLTRIYYFEPGTTNVP
jgi:hypothetical protein